MKKKKIIIIISLVIVILLVLLFPIKRVYYDGGTKEYRALLYQAIVWHKLDSSYESGYKTGTEYHFFPNNFHSVDYYDEVKPDTLTIKSSNSSIEANIGTYCISKVIDKVVKNVCADSIDPLNMEYKSILEINSKEKLSFDNTNLNIYKTEAYKSDGNIYSNVLTYSKETKLLDTPSESGEYIIILGVKYDTGDVSYSFKIKVN